MQTTQSPAGTRTLAAKKVASVTDISRYQPFISCADNIVKQVLKKHHFKSPTRIHLRKA